MRAHLDMLGRLEAQDVVLSAACVSPYFASELADMGVIDGADVDGPDEIYGLLRDPKELEKAAPTFNGVLLFRKHTGIPPTAAWPRHHVDDIVGQVSGVHFVDPFLLGSLLVWDADIIADIFRRGACLSAGFQFCPRLGAGTWRGLHYDGVMQEIVGNHVACVEQPRVPEARIPQLCKVRRVA